MTLARSSFVFAAASITVGLIALNLPAEAFAQGSRSDNGVEHKGSSCPNEGWTRGGKGKYPNMDRCYPTSASSPRIYRVGHDNEKCAAGYGRQWGFCIEGYDPSWMANQKGNLDKANAADRCPAGWVTAPPLANGQTRCRPEVPKPATARAKGAGACKPGEIEEWGIWCTSNYEHLKAQRVKQAAAADWNDIYTATRGKEPRQSPDDNGSEVYKALLAKEGGAAPSSSGGVAGMPAGVDPSNSASVHGAAAAPAETAASGCTAEEVGGALGQAVGGETGAALGKMFGGLAAKVGKTAC